MPVLSTERKNGETYAITDICENFAAAVRLADWLLSKDGYMVSEGGILFCEEYLDYSQTITLSKDRKGTDFIAGSLFIVPDHMSDPTQGKK